MSAAPQLSKEKVAEYLKTQSDIVNKCLDTPPDQLTDEQKMAIYLSAGLPWRVDGHPDTPEKCRIVAELRFGIQSKPGGGFQVYIDDPEAKSKVKLRKTY